MAPLSRHRTKQYLELLVAPLMLRKERHTSADSKFARTSEMSNGGQGERRSSRCRKTSAGLQEKLKFIRSVPE
ncbi:hypothetical protein PC113_g14576 [Phytophthora cactorum]|uniref:Uncharacterized protein n=1 Tax=Phytophthora cactorum TaxID=29920 RepID=A0A8T0YUH8_9STRA|nr:hypothetical protein PC113_g14576 [Phytophthora cactorum]